MSRIGRVPAIGTTLFSVGRRLSRTTGTLANAGEDLEALEPPTDQLPDTGGPAIHPLGAMVVGTTAFLLLVAALASSLRQRS